jgi:type I restriction enzyme M protein
MTSTQQRAELQRQIWQIANEVRGSVDGWDFKQYVLGTLFYRFISENFASYIEGGDESVKYATLKDDVITAEIKDDAIKTKGYFIYPSQLFINIAANANNNANLNTDLAALFSGIESSANGYSSELDIKGLFADFDTTSNRLGNTVADKNTRLAAVLKGVEKLSFGNFEESQIDLFGDAYEFLISNYAANAGKSGGEFFTPQHVSKLIAQLAMHKQTSVNKIYDPAAGSGSLLLQAKKHFDAHIIEDGFFGQEINHTTYNLARMNMFLHNINYDKFNMALGDTLKDPHFGDDKPFDAIVSNPPYSINWIGSDDPTLINDERFAPAGVLAPKSKADFAFVLHSLSYLSSKGRAAIVCFPGIFYRGGAEQKIRQYLVDNNYVETVISLAPNLFFGTSIAVNILVLSKHKTDNLTQFIDASSLYEKGTNNNLLTDSGENNHIEQIMQAFDKKDDVAYFSRSVEYDTIAANDYNLSVSIYVEAKDTRVVIDITTLNAELKTTVTKIDQLSVEIDAIVAEIGGTSDTSFMEKLLESVQVEWKALWQVTTWDKKFNAVSREKQPKVINYPYLLAADLFKLQQANGDVFLLSTGERTGWTTEKLAGTYLREGEVVTIPWGKSRPVKDVIKYYKGRFVTADNRIATSNDTDKLLNKFLYYWLMSQAEVIDSFYRGSGIQHPSMAAVLDMKIPIPPIDIQAKIVRILDAFTSLTAELTAEITARNNQYSYYRDLLFSFPKVEVEA